MPRTPPKPYYSTTPWTGFTQRERKRTVPLKRCPQASCRRAKQCQAAHDNLYCQRTHISITESNARSNAPEIDFGHLPRNPTKDQMAAKRAISDQLAAEAANELKYMTDRWKRGDLDGVYGPWNKRGALMVPPVRQYTE